MTSINVYNPFDQSLIESIPQTSEANTVKAMDDACALFDDRKKWMPPYQRVEILERVVEIMSSQIEQLTLLAASEGGKPYIDSKVEVMRAINGVKLAIEHIPAIKGEEIPMGHTASSANRFAFTRREPIGPVVSVSAFNHPLNLIVHQTVPAIAVGCPVVIKPAALTPLSCFRFVEILHEAGLPQGWCTAVLPERDVAERLVCDSRTNFFSFIGSAKVGWMLQSKLSPGTRSALEHGGAAPVIVDQSMLNKQDKLDEMVASLTKGGFYHAGQVCVSVQRVYTPSSTAEDLANRIAEAAKSLKVGNQSELDVEVGPLITPKELDRIDQWVKSASNGGAKVMCGGERISDTCYMPTVLLNPPEDCEVSQMEIFGPVVCVYGYDDKTDAVNRANGLPFAFQASVFTHDLDDALKTSQELNATAVMVNDHTAFRVDWMPFGGRDASGIGMGGIPYSMHEMTRDKMTVIKSDVLL